VVVEPTVDNKIPRPNHEPQPFVAIVIVQELPQTLKDKKRKFLHSVSTLPRTRTRSERSIVTTTPTSTTTTSTSIPSPVAPTTTQNSPVAIIIIPVSTVSSNESIQPTNRINSPSAVTTVQTPIITAT